MKLRSIFAAFLQRQPAVPKPPTQGYGISGNKVYYLTGYNRIELAGADARSFQKLDASDAGYARDKNQVYLNGRVIKGADSPSFTRIRTYFSRDEFFVYYHADRLSGDPAHFTFVDDHVQKDRRHVYRGGWIISNDPLHFQVLDCIDGLSYYRDKETVYVNGMRITGADPDTFQPLRHGFSSDARRVYQVDGMAVRIIKDAQPASFSVYNAYYTHDTNQVFWNDKPLPGADPSIFAALKKEHSEQRDCSPELFMNRMISELSKQISPA